jgi:hypothetical protein
MQRIHYASGSVLTGDDISEALLAYAEVLGAQGKADVVHVPVLLPEGRTASAALLIGPASQIACIPEVSEAPELRDAGIVAELRQRARTLTSGAPWTSQYSDALALEDYE